MLINNCVNPKNSIFMIILLIFFNCIHCVFPQMQVYTDTLKYAYVTQWKSFFFSGCKVLNSIEIEIDDKIIIDSIYK